MVITELRIGEQLFHLVDGVDVVALKRTIVKAVQAGGGFVDIPAQPSWDVSVLLSPGSDVRFLTREQDSEVDEGPAISTRQFEFEDDLYGYTR